MKDWFIADTHFSHKNILAFEPEGRPFDTVEEHDQEIISRWNSVVNHNDRVFLLGDVAFSSAFYHLLFLNGRSIVIVLGNHDYPNKIKQILDTDPRITVCGCLQYKGGILTHIPIHESQLNRYKFNMHGHLHSDIIDDPRYICVSAEQSYLYPIDWDTLKVHIDKLNAE